MKQFVIGLPDDSVNCERSEAIQELQGKTMIFLLHFLFQEERRGQKKVAGLDITVAPQRRDGNCHVKT